MSALAKIRTAWDAFWFRKVPPHSLAAFRILFGLYLLAYFLRFAPNVELSFSNHGVYAPFLVPEAGLPPFWAWTLYLVTLLVITAFILGFQTTFATPVLLGFFLYYYFLNFAVRDTAFDRLNLIFLATLCFAQLDRAWSLGGGRRARQDQDGLVSIWPIRIITLQIAFLYFGAGFWKLVSPPWHSGAMLRWTLAGP